MDVTGRQSGSRTYRYIICIVHSRHRERVPLFQPYYSQSFRTTALIETAVEVELA
jgi:hypothetical protein